MVRMMEDLWQNSKHVVCLSQKHFLKGYRAASYNRKKGLIRNWMPCSRVLCLFHFHTLGQYLCHI